MSSLPATPDRVPLHTDPEVNEAIRRKTERAVIDVATEGPEAIGRRLAEIEREWDVERVIEANASGLALTFTLLGAFASPWFLAVPALVTAFLLQHAISGWCQPVPILRRLGIRTLREIDEERFALKALRGDFDHVREPTTLKGDQGLNAIKAART